MCKMGPEDEVFMTTRDYDLLGESGARAVEIGLATAEWYHTDIDREALHLLGESPEGELAAYLRVLPPGTDNTSPAIIGNLCKPCLKIQSTWSMICSKWGCIKRTN